MGKKTYRVKLKLDGDTRDMIYRTDGVPTHCCEAATSYFCWEKNTKFNYYQGWSGYVSKGSIKEALEKYNPDDLDLEAYGLTGRAKIERAFTRLGFEVHPKDELASKLSVFGTIEAEPYDTGKDHFVARNRNVFFGTGTNGYYITSNLHGSWRGYRCRRTEDAEIGNIFGHGKTIDLALKDFAHKFTNKIYNRR